MKSIKIVLILASIFFPLSSSVIKETAHSASPPPVPPYLHVQISPRCIAINPLTDQAVVTDFFNKKVSVIDLHTQNILSTITLSKMPLGVAIDQELNLAVVSHPIHSSVSVISLDNFQVVKTISAGMLPVGVSVDLISHKALISNFLSNSVSVIDLATLARVGTISVGLGSVDVAIDSERRLALVANALGNKIFVIDLETSQVVRTVTVGMIPVSVNINPETHLAGVVNLLGNSISVIDLQSWETRSISVGAFPLDLAINSLDNRALVICDMEKKVILVDLNTGTIVNEYPLNNKRFTGVAVDPYMNIGALVDDTTGELTLIQLPNPVPAITYINPDTILRGSPPMKVTIEGSAFIKTSTVSNFQVHFIDNHHLEIDLSESLLANTGTYEIVVTNPVPNGGSSNSVDLKINNPIPALTALDPSETTAGTSGLTLNILGTGFFTDTLASINGNVRGFTFIDRTKIQTPLIAEDLDFGKYLDITAFNPPPGGGSSNALRFTVLNSAPVLTSIVPNSIIAGSPNFTLTLNGENFVKTSIVSFNGQAVVSAYVSKTQLQATVPATAITTPGSYSVKVTNPTPGGGETSPLQCTVKPSLEITVTSPLDGEIMNRSKIMVRGTVRSDTNDIGITVNGVFANIRGTEWVANNIPLTVAENTITAVATNSSGNRASKSITVTTSPIIQSVGLSANATSGITPLQLFFSVSTEGFTPVSYQMDFEGDGIVDYTGATLDDIDYTYTAEGIFYPTITVTDGQGNIYSDTIAITGLSRTEIDTLLRTKWEGMKGALSQGDIEGALVFFDDFSKSGYKEHFTVLSPMFSKIVQELNDIQLVGMMTNAIEYDIRTTRNGIEYSFYLLFVRDKDGLWKIRSF